MTTRLFVLICMALAISGCNTVSGIGKDIKKAGSAIERAAQ
ncbi:entericidin A/B family lipoprotein [Vogesella sp. DC21W]|uniref:Entericidin A/B family lipoprotein n=1 Tax=Vogesella aquatica TaxID=2984206 RepID=A0ABT5J091_9NEIS|nr:entericidin A/B family lipoprotein [Vogesella aquatica]MDC7717813.1 entericidin A/B family lipoprotein [Vogesella aquatica]